MDNVRGSKTLVGVLTVLVIMNPFIAAASNDPLLNTLPADVLFCVRINEFNTSLGAMDQFLMGTSPMPLSLAMLVNMQLIGIVGDPTLAGIDQNGTFMAVGIVSDDDSVDVTIIAPVTDYDAFITENPACSPSGTPGVTLFKNADSPAGTMAIMPVPGGKYALVNSQEHIDELLTLHKQLAADTPRLAARLDADQTAQALTAPAWLYVNLARIFDRFGESFIQGIENTMQQMPEKVPMAGIMEMYSAAINAIAKQGAHQADALTLAVTPQPSVLNLDIAFRAKDGSDLAAMLVADPRAAKDFTMAGFSDNAAAVNVVFKTNRGMGEKLSAVVTDFMQDIVGDKFAPADIEQIISLVEKSNKASGDETFFSFSYGRGQPPFMMRQVQQMADPAVFKSVMQQGVAVANSFYKAMGLPAVFSYEPAVESYNSIEIDAFTFDFNFSDMFDASEMGQAETDFVAQMYGADGMTYYGAQKDNLFYLTFGPNAQSELKALLDAPADRPPAGELKTAMTILGPAAQRADMIGSINLIKLVRGGLAMVQQTGAPAELLAPIVKALDIQTQSCMAAATTIDKGKIAGRLALPKQHLAEILNVAMQIQMQMMQGQGGMGDGMTPQPEPASPFAMPPTAEHKDPLHEWIGKPAPDMVMKDLQGSTVSIAGQKGKKLILDFWATWCPPCKEMIPDLIALRERNDPARLAILGVSNEPIDRLSKFAKEYKMNYPVISHTGAVPDPYGKIVGIPTTFFIDSSGVIRHILVGYHELHEIQTALDSMQ